ncbi:DUF1294 domain-containing protein [Bacillus sp. BGMRC 2118]|nr:DUF1294 domain-containing protein [Bacillus sp. BGMRC 2118]
MIYILGYILLINILGFYVMYQDKLKAKRNEWRTPERTLWMYAFVGGVFGVYSGMRVFRHKTKHRSFKYGLPFVMVAYLTIFVFLLQKLS